MPTATLNRPLRILFLGMLLAAPAVRADSYTDFQDASARLEAMVAKATPQSGLPRVGDPGVAALFAQAADGPRLFQAPVAALQDMNQSVAVCERATNLGKAYYTFGLQRPLLLSGAELQQARREQVTQNLANYGDEMAALFAFGVHCHAHLIGLMEAEFSTQPAQGVSGAERMRARAFSKGSSTMFANVVQFVQVPFWNVAQKNVMLATAAQHATANANLMAPPLRERLLTSLADADKDLDPSLAPALATIRQALAVTTCTGLCQYY
ncbi:MAG: hypothetical protein I8H79_15590 [Burkholderiales bacterium]|uniref:Uncharacterized protein n=1 Tax=Janthinobacterium tructae TaxID=2590869 RepID=A0A4Y6RHZ8_9BURK|nr:hypothetical protein [Janthinobacterium tructae]MBH1983970.1 hypothetical protein [Burkholderiales bacterium]MBH1996323.1 hypothetical protein [Burkholderiales bacterium]MBH2067932.1 hypothetical protein [Burkholderiales bacterium]QDG72632.1 hypothetical protein FJQ89_21040 [Janthinobacterium tructae]